MKLGAFAALFGDQPLEAMLDIVAGAGCKAVEIGTGAYPGNPHCPLEELVKDAAKANAWLQQITDHGLEVSALSCHGNVLHPNIDVRHEHDAIFHKTIDLASMLGITTVINFSGCPGGAPGDKTPNWVTCPWPNDFGEVLKYQWEVEAIPYWREMNGKLAAAKVRVALEPHPGFLVYNPETAGKLRVACGPQIGVNFDPSHLWWQGINPANAVRMLGNAIFHVHAKDCKVNDMNASVIGVLDTKPYTEEEKRAWLFRTCGYGHGAEAWKEIVSALRLAGYDGAISIEHEDSLMRAPEGFRKAATFLQEIIITEPAGPATWV
jgi:sugar phosphate isomerase/epimerase